MKHHTQTILYHLLPVVFWLLAAGGLVCWVFFSPYAFEYTALLPGVMALLCIFVLGRIKRHDTPVEPCFRVAVLLGVASYWLPSVLFLFLPMAGYLMFRHQADLRAFCAALVGFALVAVWAAILIIAGRIDNPWAHFFTIENARGWIPTGVMLVAWLASTIVRQTLRER